MGKPSRPTLPCPPPAGEPRRIVQVPFAGFSRAFWPPSSSSKAFRSPTGRKLHYMRGPGTRLARPSMAPAAAFPPEVRRPLSPERRACRVRCAILTIEGCLPTR